MLLQMVMQFGEELGGTIHSASIVKWHKSEGERIHYGDVVFDLKVEEIIVSSSLWGWEDIALPSAVAGMAAQQLQVSGNGAGQDESAEGQRPIQSVFLLRAISSDSGILRKVCAGEGQRRKAGDLLAVLSTEEQEPLEDPSATVPQAGRFRVVANAFHEEGDDGYQRRIEETEIERSRSKKMYVGRESVLLWSESLEGLPIGIYASGARYCNPLFACAPLIQPLLRGGCCIFRDGPTNARSDLLLQTTRDLPPEWVKPVIEKLELPPSYFQPRFFDKTFLVSGPDGVQEFPKTVIALSIVPDVVSTCYRHRELGFLVDPGPSWVTHYMAEAESGYPEKLLWFHENFESVGKMTVELFQESFAELVRVTRACTGAYILVFNTVTASPGAPCHNYQFLSNQRGRRRLEFNLALVELSRKLDFPIVDVDRIFKRAGVQAQVNWDSFDPRLHLLVAEETLRIFKGWGVFEGGGLYGRE